MAKRATIAGIIGLVSLVIPLEISFYKGGFALGWTVFEISFYNGRSFFSFATQWLLLDGVMTALLIIVVLVGGILLLAAWKRPKIGASFVTAGVVLFVLDLVYDKMAYHGFGMPIPLGFFFMIASAVVGMAANPVKPTTPMEFRQAESPIDRLVKLKAFLDSGTITKEEFEEQKKIILRA